MWKEISLDDKPIIDRFFQSYPTELSDYTFTNLWIWNEERHYHYQVIEECLCIRFDFHGSPIYLMPTGTTYTQKLFDQLLNEMPNFRMRAISEEKIEPVQSFLPSLHVIEESEHSDYLYRFDDLKSLAGNALQPKRNLVHQFEDHYEFLYQAIDSALLSKVIQMHKQLPETYSTKAELRALLDFERLHIQGGALLVDNEVIAYTLGEKLNPDTWVIHEEEALTEFKGAYQAINQMFLQHLPEATYVNREEDLGIPGLEHAKHSYHPVKMIKKYILL